MQKTNAIRIIEAKRISFELSEYVVDENELDAITVANKIGADPEKVFKTLIATDGSNYFVFVIPGPYELDLKKCAKITNSKKIELIKVKEILPLTGYIRGGCSPIGMKKQFPTFIDETATLFDFIFVSAGVRGCQIKIEPAKLLDVTGSIFTDLI